MSVSVPIVTTRRVDARSRTRLDLLLVMLLLLLGATFMGQVLLGSKTVEIQHQTGTAQRELLVLDGQMAVLQNQLATKLSPQQVETFARAELGMDFALVAASTNIVYLTMQELGLAQVPATAYGYAAP
jgi:cell division protein FtsB